MCIKESHKECTFLVKASFLILRKNDRQYCSLSKVKLQMVKLKPTSEAFLFGYILRVLQHYVYCICF